ncbi:hypothetical protein FHETE_5592 [Fusarium heterosporum]|uniref:Uncharacterized protein n=1 Tax=Fusarium heterosporum TaxID=42747 RepID=A0A8H5TDD8_FUSHE|nr:hypothetical protein FHETE_5592 [Fusarium heterosporum]
MLVGMRRRRLQTADYDELADEKLSIASMIDNLAPKRRGRPPKIRPHGESSKLNNESPSSRPRGRPRKETPKIMSNRQIAKRLYWRMRRSKMGERVGKACRTVNQITGQWPWDLATDFPPKRWGVAIVESLRKLFNIVHRQSVSVDYGHKFQVVKDHLRDSAIKRNRRLPRLDESDVKNACIYFAAHNDSRNEVARPNSRPRRLTTLLDLHENSGSGQDDSEDEDSTDPTGDYHGNNEAASKTEREDWVGHDGHDKDHTIVEGASAIEKRSRSSSILSRTPKRACTIEPDSAGDVMDVSTNHQSKSNTTSQSARPQSFADFINLFELLKDEKQRELRAVKISLQEITASIQATESSTSQGKTINETIDKLCSNIKEYEMKREKTLTAQKFVRENYELLDWEPEMITMSEQQNATKLETFDRLIAQANADVLEEREKITQRDSDLKAEERRLRMRHAEVHDEVRHCHTIGTLMKLSPLESTTLLAKLEEKDISLVQLAEDVMAGSNVESEQKTLISDDIWC